MIAFVCRVCSYSLRTTGNDAEDLLGMNSPWYPDKYRCPLCDGHMSIGVNAIGVVVDLTPQELFAAFSGLGLPMERECGELAVKEAFQRSHVHKVHTQLVNRKRCCVQYLELEDGTKVYLGSSVYGAVVYRISKPHSYTKELLEELQKEQ